MWVFTEDEKRIIGSLLQKGRQAQLQNEKFAIIDFDNFYRLFTEEEVAVIKKYLAIDPKKIDYRLPFLGLEKIPQDIVPIVSQSYVIDGRKAVLPSQYLPKQAFDAYQKLNEAIFKELDKRLLVLYGYRSPARQVFMFFDILERIYTFDFNKTLARVCFPAYSEHVFPKRQAIDFITQDGIKSEGFEETTEYQWLKKNAAHFNFIESYPKDNTLGMMYEPWHWHYETC